MCIPSYTESSCVVTLVVLSVTTKKHTYINTFSVKVLDNLLLIKPFFIIIKLITPHYREQ